MNRLPQHHHPIFYSDRFKAFSNDKFFVSVEAEDPKFDTKKTRALLEGAPVAFVELVLDEEEDVVIRASRTRTYAGFALRSRSRPLAGCRGETTKETPIVGIRGMYDQPRYDMQAKSEFFEDHRTMRMPVENTVSREAELDPQIAQGRLPDDSGYVLTIPKSVVDAAGGHGRRSSPAVKSATASTARRATTRRGAARAWRSNTG